MRNPCLQKDPPDGAKPPLFVKSDDRNLGMEENRLRAILSGPVYGALKQFFPDSPPSLCLEYRHPADLCRPFLDHNPCRSHRAAVSVSEKMGCVFILRIELNFPRHPLLLHKNAEANRQGSFELILGNNFFDAKSKQDSLSSRLL